MLCFRIYLPHPFAYLKRALSWLARVSGGDGGELNSPSVDSNLPGLLASLFDQLISLGKIAAQIKGSLKI